MENDNIYKYGSSEIQENPNTIIACYDQAMEFLTNQKQETKKGAQNKVTGAIVAEIFKKNIEATLEKLNINDLKVSENNVYIEGYGIEFDFLILKKDAKKKVLSISGSEENQLQLHLPIYRIEDVIAILESKTFGVYTLYKRHDPKKALDRKKELEKHDLYKLVSTYKNILEKNKNIKLGYMCLAEQRPKSDTAVSNFIKKTVYFFEDYFEQKWYDSKRTWNIYYAKCHYEGKTEDKYATDQTWENFIKRVTI